ncbi:aspartyl protease family protein [Terriglobus roseus]|uniref:aspartyl protease family protein n=1 Tax=Terriglobus roseus TaxID=392734 RepID=UPI00059F9613|nr:aspartyl protease family protein [Terriglobus roseus]
MNEFDFASLVQGTSKPQGLVSTRRMFAVVALGIAALTQQGVAQSQPTTIALKPYLGVLWSFGAEIGGKPGVFLFDTGGGITVITPESAKAIGCAPWGQLSGFRMRGDRVDMTRCNDVSVRANGATLMTATVGVFDFAKLLPKDAPPLAGSVALSSFTGKVVTIDLGHQ